MSTEISVDIAVDMAVDTRSIVGRHSSVSKLHNLKFYVVKY